MSFKSMNLDLNAKVMDLMILQKKKDGLLLD